MCSLGALLSHLKTLTGPLLVLLGSLEALLVLLAGSSSSSRALDAILGPLETFLVPLQAVPAILEALPGPLATLLALYGGNPLKPRKFKPPFRLFSYPPGGLRGLNFIASKRYHFKKWSTKMVPFENFSFSPLKPPKIEPPVDLRNMCLIYR